MSDAAPPAQLAALAEAWTASAAGALKELLGVGVELTFQGADHGERDALLADSAAWVQARLRSDGDSPVELHLVLASEVALGLAALRLGAAVEGGAEAAFEGELRDAFVACAEPCASALGEVLSGAGLVAGLEHIESERLAVPLPDTAPLAPGSYRRARFALRVEEQIEGELFWLLPEAVAEAWLGPPAESGIEEGERRALMVVDPDPERRQQAEALAGALGRPVWTLDPAELGPHSLDEVEQSGAVVVTWDLGGRPGLDLLETWMRDERTRELPMAVAAEAPTRDQVLLALRWGARSFLQLPYEADEIRRRLLTEPGKP